MAEKTDDENGVKENGEEIQPKKKKSLAYYLGSYKVPGFVPDLVKRHEERRSNPEFVEKRQKNRRRITIVTASLAGTAVLFFAGLFVWQFIESRKPKPIQVSYRVKAPSPTDAETRETEPLVIEFRGSTAPLESVGQAPELPVKMEPAVDGYWEWTDDRNLVFHPQSDWPIGQEYKCRFPDGFFPDHLQVENDFEFAIESMELRIYDGEFYIDPRDSRVKRVLATVQSNYPMNESMLEGRISIEPQLNADSGSFEDRPYTFSLTFSDTSTKAFILSEPIGNPADDVMVEIELAEGVRSSWGGLPATSSGKTRVTVPGASTYIKVNTLRHLLVANADQGYDQILALETRGTVALETLEDNLTVLQLPRSRPALPGIPAPTDHRGNLLEFYHWNNIDEMLPEVLELAQNVEFQGIPNDEEHSAFSSFQFSAQPGSYIYVKVPAGTPFYGGYALAEDHEQIMRVEEYPRELSIVSEGALLSMTGDRTLSMLTRGVEAVSYRIGRIRPDDINHIVSQSNGNLSNFQFQNYRFDEDNVSDFSYDRERILLRSASRPTYFSFDFNNYLSTIPERGLRYGLFFFEVAGRGKNAQYEDKRLIMVTDLGLYVKSNDDGAKVVFAQSIATGGPVSGVRVQVLGLNGNPVAEGFTNSQGMVEIPDLSNLDRENEPVVYAATRGNDMSFLPYQAPGRYLDYSSFDVGGVRGATDPEALNAYMFSDRGIYRPGDEIRLGVIVKAGDWSVNPEGTPLECHITDSRGQTVYVDRIRLSSSGFEEIRYRSQEYSPTGVYDAVLYMKETDRRGNTKLHFLGSTSVKVEEFLPDNLEVDARILPLPGAGWIKPENLSGFVSVRNLFGTPAVEARVNAELTLSPGYRRFPGFEDYRFFDPYLQDNRFEESLGSKLTDEEGSVEFPIDLSRFETASYNLTFYVEAFEKGSGRSVSHEARTFISPMDSIVGYKADGRLDYISLGAQRNVDFVALGPDLESVAVNDLTLSIEEITYVSVLVRQANGVYKYQSVERPNVIESRSFDIAFGGTQLALPTGQSGEYVLRLRDSQGRELSSSSFTIAGAANIQRSLNRSAELEITLSSQDYAPGEMMEIFIKAPYVGAGLITIEREKIYSHQWFRSDGTSSVQRIRVPADIEGNGYVNVSFLRSQDSPEVFMSPLSYGAVPFSVSREAQTNVIELDFPEEAKPGQAFVINYSTSRRGRIAIFAVDEGILQVAGYQQPDPLSFFFRKRALEVRTAQILDLVLPEHSVVQSLAAMGGGGPGDEFLSRNLNPFRRRTQEPVAYWSGVIDSGPETSSVSYDVPGHFNGTLRVMAVAVAPDAIGAVNQRATIRDTYVIRPNAPLALTPGDEFEVAVTVANNRKDSGTGAQILLEAQANEQLEILGENSQTLTIDEGKDTLVVFQARAAGPLGNGEIRFTASGGGEESVQWASMSIRPTTPFRISVFSGVVEDGNDGLEMQRTVREEYAEQNINLAFLPLALANGLEYYLSRFPYGCTEQIISATFPLLYDNLVEHISVSSASAEEKTAATLGILQARQKEDGSLGLWTSRSENHPHIDAYAALFLAQARRKGYEVPDTLYEGLLSHLEDIAKGRTYDPASLRNRAFAIYALTSDDRVTTSYIETLVDDLDKHGEEGWETDYTGLFLAGSYAMLQQEREGATLLRRIRRDFRRQDTGIYLDKLGYSAFYMKVLGSHFPRRLGDISVELLDSIAEALGDGVYTTISANFVLMGIDAYMEASPDAESGEFSVEETLADGSERTLDLQGDPLFSADFTRNASELSIRNRSDLSLYWQATQAGFDDQLPEESESRGIEVYRVFQDREGETPEEFQLGEAAQAVLRLRSIDEPVVEQVAVVDMLPAGFEADIESLRSGGGPGSWKPDYIDIREDRVVFYGTLDKKMAEFSYTIRPISRGTFVTPPLFAEAMYDKETWSMTLGDSVTVR